MKKNIRTALTALILFIVVLIFGIASSSCVGRTPVSKSSNSTLSTSNDGSNPNARDWESWKQFQREYNL